MCCGGCHGGFGFGGFAVASPARRRRMYSRMYAVLASPFSIGRPGPRGSNPWCERLERDSGSNILRTAASLRKGLTSTPALHPEPLAKAALGVALPPALADGVKRVRRRTTGRASWPRLGMRYG